jgi:hypothetical protein
MQLHLGRTAETLSEAAKIFRDAFVREYVKDFKGDQALFRLGYSNQTTAVSRAYTMLREPYVAQRLDEVIRQMRPEDVVQRQQVLSAMWKEANDEYNEDSTRVAALAHCAKMLGMMNQKEETHTAPIGVMLVPMIAVEDWKQTAVTSQAMLKRQVVGQN